MVSITISGIILFLLLCLIFSVEKVTDSYMEPLINKGDWVVGLKNKKKLKRFDIVGIKKGDKKSVGRIIGLPGEEVRYDSDYLYINGQPVEEKFIIPQINEALLNGDFYTKSSDGKNKFIVGPIPDDYYLILNDNRLMINDSRFYGLVKQDKIGYKVTSKFIKFKIIPIK